MLLPVMAEQTSQARVLLPSEDSPAQDVVPVAGM